MRCFEIQAIEEGQLPVVSGNDIGGLGGRVSSLESVRRSLGENKKNQLRDQLFLANKTRQSRK